MRRAALCPAIRQSLVRLPPPHDAHYGVVPPPPPREGVDIRPVAESCRQALDAIAYVDAIVRDLGDHWMLTRLLPRREAVASSAIEGTWSTLDELLSVEETQDETVFADAAAGRQVRSYALTLERLVPDVRASGPTTLTRDLIATIHAAVMKDDPAFPDEPGVPRACTVWIGAGDISRSIFNPPPHDHVARCLDDAVNYMRADDMHAVTQSIVTRMAVSHAHFEAVHPFRDGNGRVGRLLLPLMMAADGHEPLYLSPYVEAHKGAYGDALQAAQQRLEWAPMVGFIADAIVGTVEELKQTRAVFQALRDIWLGRQKFRNGSAARRALDLLPHYPIITINRLAALLDVSFPAASRAATQLAEAGILRERTGYTRNRVFAAREALAVLNRPFGEDPDLPDA